MKHVLKVGCTFKNRIAFQISVNMR